MFGARAVLGIVLYFKEKVLKPLRKDGYLNRYNLPETEPDLIQSQIRFFFLYGSWRGHFVVEAGHRDAEMCNPIVQS